MLRNMAPTTGEEEIVEHVYEFLIEGHLEEKVVINPKDIIFRVQIAAHTIQINDDYLKSIYSGSYKIDEVYEEGWYKYQIGMFKTLEEAEKVLNESQVKKAFVVAYQDGRKLTLHQAEDILQKHKN